MQVPTDQFTALNEQVAALATRVGQLEHDAFMIRTLEEMHLRYLGLIPDRGGQVRHLRPVGDEGRPS